VQHKGKVHVESADIIEWIDATFQGTQHVMLARWHDGMLLRWHVGTLARWHVGMLAR